MITVITQDGVIVVVGEIHANAAGLERITIWGIPHCDPGGHIKLGSYSTIADMEAKMDYICNSVKKGETVIDLR